METGAADMVTATEATEMAAIEVMVMAAINYKFSTGTTAALIFFRAVCFLGKEVS
jgi:hypothetical protein